MFDSFDNLLTQELRNIAIDQGILAAHLMNRESLLESLRGDFLAAYQSPEVYQYLGGLPTKKLRNESLDRGIFAARFMTRESLLRSLHGESLALQDRYLIPIALIWKLVVAIPLVVIQAIFFLIQVVTFPFKAVSELFVSESQPSASKSTSSELKPTITSQTVQEPDVSVVLVRVREVLIREVSIVQVSRSKNNDA